MEDAPLQEQLVRIEGKWTHEVADFKKIWPMDEDFQLATNPPFSFSPDLPADEQCLLATERLRFNGAQVLPLRDGDGSRATAYMLSPPVRRTPELDLHVATLSAKVQQPLVAPSQQAYHIVAFGSAGHALRAGATGTPSVTARTTAGPLISTRSWKTGVTVLARNEVPTRPGLATTYVSPNVAKKSRSRLYPDVKERTSSGSPFRLDFLNGVIQAECDPFSGHPFPYLEGRRHANPWWYVPTKEEPKPEEIFYVLQVPGAVRVESMVPIYGVPSNREQLTADAMNREVLCPDTLSVSVGDVISFSEEIGKIRASTTGESSGGAVGKLGDRPLLLYGTHIRGNFDEPRLCSDAEANFNYFHRVTEPHFACAYVEGILPILESVPSATWPGGYMVTALQEYLQEMAPVLKAQKLWPVVESFYKAQQWVLP